MIFSEKHKKKKMLRLLLWKVKTSSSRDYIQWLFLFFEDLVISFPVTLRLNNSIKRVKLFVF